MKAIFWRFIDWLMSWDDGFVDDDYIPDPLTEPDDN